jgi:hypothetical protein
MSKLIGKNPPLALGAVPRADLLPPEIAREAQARSQRRGLVGAVIALVVVVGLAYAGVSFLAANANAELGTAQARTTELATEQSKYSDIRTLTSKVGQIKVDQQLGTSTEIDWKKYLLSVEAVLPSGATLQTVAITSSTPITPLGDSTSPLESTRIAEIVFTASTKDVPDIVELIDSLSELPGYTDATPSVTSVDPNYSLTVTMHVNSDALANRFGSTEESK